MVFRRAWLGVLQNTQFVVTTLTVLAILRIRTAHALWFGAGTLVAAFSAKILKKFIRQPRPVGARKYEKTYGMPSTHSSSIAYFGTYLSLSSILLPLHPRVTSLFPFYSYLAPLGPGAVEPSFWRNLATEWGERVTRLSMATFFLAGAASVCWSRVRLGHHTPAQVLVGASLGSAVALTWLLLWLGVTEAGTLGGFGVTGLGGMVPGWLVGGIREQGMVWERAVEDAMFVAFEAWQDRNWKGLKTLRSFPVAEL